MSSAKPRNLILIARRQRMLLWAILGVILSNIMVFNLASMNPTASLVASILTLVLQLFVVVQTVRLCTALRVPLWGTVLLVPLLFLPLLNILTMLFINTRATKLLQKQGVRVGLMGAPASEYPKLIPGHCRGCGYDRQGIEAASPCPECGCIPTDETA